ncbi:MAG: T9SS type A sorting domain-containing protein [Ignavibacteria bacterium]|nr:T9SS type A sorting domain-containing protein [Ignavibacteria bacterium]
MNKTFLFSHLFFLFLVQVTSAQWQHVFNPGSRILSIKQIEDRIYLGTEDYGAWLSKNDGLDWINLPTASLIGSYDIKDFEFDGQSVWIGSIGGSIIYSANGETNWQVFENGFTTQTLISRLIKIGDTLFAAHSTDIGLQVSGIYKTHINSANWEISGIGFPDRLYSISSFILTNSNFMYVGAQGNGQKGNLFVSKNSGKNWHPKFVENYFDVNCLTTNSINIYAGTGNGIYHTTEEDSIWKNYSDDLKGFFVDDIVYNNAILYAAIENMGLICSNDDGKTWKNITYNLPLENDYISKLYFSNEHIYVGLGSENGLWKVPLSLVYIEEDYSRIESFELHQNYPNPFNPTTKIRYSVPIDDIVQLSVYNVLGEEVKTLINEYKRAGSYEANFDASNFSGGVYFYRLICGNYSVSKKMIQLR